MRTIDADALKELFSEVIGHIAKKPEMNGNLEHMIRASAMVIQMIDDAPTVNALNCSEIPNNWVPCSERLPKESRKYLVTVFDGIGKRTTSALYHRRSKSWTLTGRMAYWKVIAWMPLPEPARLENGR